MKTKKEILEHCKNAGHTEIACRQICAYLIGKGIKDRGEAILFKKGENTFDDFLEWFNPKTKTNNIKFESEIIDNHDELYNFFWGVDIHKPKFNFNDWVRVKDGINGINGSGQITGYRWDKLNGFYYNIPPLYYSIREKNLVSYYPKDGEFFYVKANVIKCNYEYIGCRDSIKGDKRGNVLHFSYSLSLCDSRLDAEMFIGVSSSILELRPATKEEVQLLKDKVKKEYNKEWNGKEWVECKPQFKKGDYIISENRYHIAIVDNVENNKVSALAYYFYPTNEMEYNVVYLADLNERQYRLASSKDIKEMDGLLAEKGKYYDKQDFCIKDIKKSDKELFEDWKRENGFIAVHHEGQNTTQSLCIYNKIRAYTELYLFAQWVNQFYEEEDRVFQLECGLFSIDDLRIWVDARTSRNGSIHFNSKEGAQRAIDYLSEEQIKTALK